MKKPQETYYPYVTHHKRHDSLIMKVIRQFG